MKRKIYHFYYCRISRISLISVKMFNKLVYGNCGINYCELNRNRKVLSDKLIHI